MLVLTRKTGESIAIGNDVTIKVVEIRGGQVRIGIEAPTGLRIYREEIFLKVQQENRLAAMWNLSDLDAAVNMIGGGMKE